jgi:DNA helicase-2/ATP-dependent DNA helicase PcrA
LGQRIHHHVFGEGIVIAIEGDGDNTRAQINFETEGTKWLVLSYTKLNLM